MEELRKINRVLEREYPDAYRETLVVLDGTTGQNALSQAKEFKDVADITGISFDQDGWDGKRRNCSSHSIRTWYPCKIHRCRGKY